MTPSEELDALKEATDINQSMAVAEIQHSDNVEEDEPSSSTASKQEIRIKLVSEINGNAINAVDDSSNSSSTNGATKRKLPGWMLLSVDILEQNSVCVENSSKKSKTSECENKDGVEDEEIATSSTVAVDGAVETSENTDQVVDPTTTVQVKEEPLDGEQNGIATSSSGASTSTPALDHSGASTTDIKPALNVKKEEATSTSRESCKFGIRCYRRNPMHRIEEAHPGDHDYKRPHFPPPPQGTPDCPYGDACYRRNPVHFEQFNHPPETDFKQNWKNYCLRQRRQQQSLNTSNNSDPADGNSSESDDYDFEDPFIDDGDQDEDYEPSDSEDYDDCDKAEE